MKETILSKEEREKATLAREAVRNSVFSRLDITIGKAATDELRALYRTYDERLYIWLAALWNAEVGGFYYSNSARDNDGFLPDVESTAQVWYFATLSKMFDHLGGWQNALPEKIKEKMLDFVINLQSSDDGFFYHKQWGSDIPLSRRGRDLQWSTGIIEKLGAKPLYDTPNGKHGSIGAPKSAKAVREADSKNAASPEHLRSLSAFKDYLAGLDLKNNSYSVGNLLNSQAEQIKAAGADFCKLLADHLASNQNPETGVFSDTLDHLAINGLMKNAELLVRLGYPIPHGNEAIRSVIEMTLETTITPPSMNHVCSIYNCWVLIDLLINNAKKTEGEERAAELRKIVYERAAELIAITAKKMEVFRKPDGGFSFGPRSSCPTSQGVPAAIPGSAESDVNATVLLSGGTLSHINAVFEAEDLQLYCKEDGEQFIKLLNCQSNI